MAQSQTAIRPLLQDAQSKIGAGRIDDAIIICNDLLAMNANDSDVLNTLAIAYAHSGEAMKSVEVLAELVLNDPQTIKYKTNFVRAIGILGVRDATTDKAGLIKQAIQICLEDERIDHKAFNHIWYALLMQEPVLISIERSEGIDIEALVMPLSDSFLHFGLKRLIGAGGVPFEQLMTYLRRYFLLHVNDYDVETFLPFLCALAEQCHLNEYVYAVSDDEYTQLQAIEENLSNQDGLDVCDSQVMAKVALLGCYQDIDRSACGVAVHDSTDRIEDYAFASMVKLLIADPIQVKELQADISMLSPIRDEVSSAVREQYEDNPYPRWRCLMAPALSDEQKALGHGKEILIAGCGTGQEILNMALHYPEADITGIDLSCASLAYGKQKAEQLRIENVEFIQADILEIEQLDRQFDLITCSGVLHHMRDPVAGWKALLTRLKDDGVMKVALYSAIARTYVTQCQTWIKEQGFEATVEGISSFRQVVMAMDDNDPLKVMVEPIDFYSMSMCRDLLFHVQEHVYTLPQVREILDELDLNLLALNIKQPGVLQSYKAQYPDDVRAIDLDNWHQFEQQNPEVFVGMYPFWVSQKGKGGFDNMPDWVFVH